MRSLQSLIVQWFTKLGVEGYVISECSLFEQRRESGWSGLIPGFSDTIEDCTLG